MVGAAGWSADAEAVAGASGGGGGDPSSAGLGVEPGLTREGSSNLGSSTQRGKSEGGWVVWSAGRQELPALGW